MIALWIALGLLILAGAAALVALWTFRMAFYNPPRVNENFYQLPDGEQYDKHHDDMMQMIKELDDAPFEWVETVAYDGLPLKGRFYNWHGDGAPIQIQFHGYKAMAIRDYSGGSRLAKALGYNVLLVEQRAQGQSGGNVISFGIRERYDCLRWIAYANARFGENTPVYLAGISMGAATVLMATEFDLPKNIRGVLADCPYSSPEKIIAKVCKGMGYPPKLAMPFLRLGARLYGGFSLRESSAVVAVQKAKVPVLIIHGDDDRFVPCEMSREIYDAYADEKTLEIFENAGHGICFLEDYDRYERVLGAFIQRCEQRAKERGQV